MIRCCAYLADTIESRRFWLWTFHRQKHGTLFAPIMLPCGVILKNRIAKPAMLDSLGVGTGHPTVEQIRLYQRWAGGGAAVFIQGYAGYAESPAIYGSTRLPTLINFGSLPERAIKTSQSFGCNSATLGRLLTCRQAVPKAQAHSISRDCAARN